MNAQAYEQYRTQFEEARATTYTANADAQNAYAAIRLLIPSVTSQARH